MKMADAMGWLAAGVLAAGLNSAYHNGGLEWAHQVVNQIEHGSNATLALATGRADRFLTEVRVLADRSETASCPFSSAVDRLQSRIERRVDLTQARAERLNDVMSAREQAELDRLEARRDELAARVEARSARLKFATVETSPVDVRVESMIGSDVCPRIHLRVPQPPRVTMPSMPVIHIQGLPTGPI